MDLSVFGISKLLDDGITVTGVASSVQLSLVLVACGHKVQVLTGNARDRSAKVKVLTGATINVGQDFRVFGISKLLDDGVTISGVASSVQLCFVLVACGHKVQVLTGATINVGQDFSVFGISKLLDDGITVTGVASSVQLGLVLVACGHKVQVLTD